MKTDFRSRSLLLTSAMLITCCQTQAAGFMFNFGDVFSSSPNGSSPASPTRPWIQAQIQDDGNNAVLLTVTAPNLTSSAARVESLESIYFNVASSIDYAQIMFTAVDNTAVSSVQIDVGANAYKADGDGRYDVRFTFPTSGSMGGAGRFTDNEQIVYRVTAPGLDATDFVQLSQPAGGSGPFYSAAHVNYNGAYPGGGGDAWINSGTPVVTPVPEPSVVSLGLAGAVALGMLHRARRVKK